MDDPGRRDFGREGSPDRDFGEGEFAEGDLPVRDVPMRDLADEAIGALRTEAPDVLAPIDPDAPVSGHRPPPDLTVPGADAPEHDWAAARDRVFPLLRAPGTAGTPLAEARSLSLADSVANTDPIVERGPAGLTVVYGIAAEGFAVLVNAEHLLSWGVDGPDLHAAAMANLATWSGEADWDEERTDERRILSSSTGDGYDASRVLLPEVRARIAEMATDAPPGSRILVGLPERDLLVAGALVPGDEEFIGLFREFLAEQAAAANIPIDERVFELRAGELVEFAG
jgi:hypothetical protein